MNKSSIRLSLTGTFFSGWERVSLDFDMEALNSAFSLDLFDKEGAVTSGFKTGLDCDIYITNTDYGVDQKVIPGFITNTTRAIADTTNTMTVSGSDRLVDIVDCAALYEQKTWLNKRFSSIITDLLKPFSLKVDIRELRDDPIIKKFTLQSGETAFSSIERLCRSQAVLPLSTFDGDLLLTYAADMAKRALVDLELGVNIKRLTETADWTERFSEYIGVGQYPGGGKKWTKQMLQGKSVAEDVGVTRYRPMLFVAEGKAERASLDKRVRWEAQIRSGRATEYSVEVDGWFQKDPFGRPLKLWEKNERVNLKADYWDIDKDLLITKVAMSLNENGEMTTLTLKHPDIFKPDPTEKVDLT